MAASMDMGVSGGDPVGVLTPTFWQWGSRCAQTPSPLFSAMLLYVTCIPVLPTVAELSMRSDFCRPGRKHECRYVAHKLHQNALQ